VRNITATKGVANASQNFAISPRPKSTASASIYFEHCNGHELWCSAQNTSAQIREPSPLSQNCGLRDVIVIHRVLRAEVFSRVEQAVFCSCPLSSGKPFSAERYRTYGSIHPLRQQTPSLRVRLFRIHLAEGRFAMHRRIQAFPSSVREKTAAPDRTVFPRLTGKIGDIIYKRQPRGATTHSSRSISVPWGNAEYRYCAWPAPAGRPVASNAFSASWRDVQPDHRVPLPVHSACTAT
jgi:hypothetical protein